MISVGVLSTDYTSSICLESFIKARELEATLIYDLILAGSQVIGFNTAASIVWTMVESGASA